MGEGKDLGKDHRVFPDWLYIIKTLKWNSTLLWSLPTNEDLASNYTLLRAQKKIKNLADPWNGKEDLAIALQLTLGSGPGFRNFSQEHLTFYNN